MIRLKKQELKKEDLYKNQLTWYLICFSLWSPVSWYRKYWRYSSKFISLRISLEIYILLRRPSIYTLRNKIILEHTWTMKLLAPANEMLTHEVNRIQVWASLLKQIIVSINNIIGHMFVNNIYNSSPKLVLKWEIVATFQFLESSTMKNLFFIIKETVKAYFANVIRCSIPRLWVDSCIYFKLTDVLF